MPDSVSAGWQVFDEQLGEGIGRFLAPPPAELMEIGIAWGRADAAFTPAYWKFQCWLVEHGVRMARHSFTLGSTLEEEVVACVLGGYGNPAEIGLAAFQRVREAGLATGTPDEAALRAQLTRPLSVGGRPVRYRFAAMRACYVARSLAFLAESGSPPVHDVAFREWLLACPGIGRKTASWITRNHRQSDQVAILDVHVLRAGGLLGIFDPHVDVSRHYLAFEKHFLRFAHMLGVRASVLDAVMWNDMRIASASARSLLLSRSNQ